MTNLIPYIIAWASLGVVVLILALMRRQIAAREDDSLHLAANEVGMVAEQATLAKKLETIDRWGKLLTIILVVTGVALALVWGYQMWGTGSKATFAE
jgi:cytochrome b subunit of formate dehydrogenase